MDKGNRYGFHLAPFRGGSPVQNAIAHGVDIGQLVLQRMVQKIDSGPILARIPMPLLGGAEEIYNRMAFGCYAILRRLADPKHKVKEEPPLESPYFARRTPDQSEITDSIGTLEGLFDHVRMLDAQGYPPAFIKVGPFTFHFNRPTLRTGAIEANVIITAEG